MVQAAQDRSEADQACLAHIVLARIGYPLLQPLMWPVTIEIGQMLEEGVPQVRLAKHEQVVQALSPERANNPVDLSVLPR